MPIITQYEDNQYYRFEIPDVSGRLLNKLKKRAKKNRRGIRDEAHYLFVKTLNKL